MLFAFHEFVQKWIIAEARESLEIRWAKSKQINRLYSTCICKNKKQNIQRSQGADVWQLIPASDVYLPVSLFSHLLRIPCSCWFFTLCSAFLRRETNEKGNVWVMYQWIWNTQEACADQNQNSTHNCRWWILPVGSVSSCQPLQTAFHIISELSNLFPCFMEISSAPCCGCMCELSSHTSHSPVVYH